MELVLLFSSGATLPVLALPWLPSSPPVVDMQLPPGSSQYRFLCLPVILLLHCSGARMSAKDSTSFTHLKCPLPVSSPVRNIRVSLYPKLKAFVLFNLYV